MRQLLGQARPSFKQLHWPSFFVSLSTSRVCPKLELWGQSSNRQGRVFREHRQTHTGVF
eukprot:m.218697 g.218697  ORF g.218697 m.218697 type:complete len:59 (-) comp18687_c3_seq7:111-287(-)